MKKLLSLIVLNMSLISTVFADVIDTPPVDVPRPIPAPTPEDDGEVVVIKLLILVLLIVIMVSIFYISRNEKSKEMNYN